MKINKFSFLILTLVFCAGSTFVSAKDNESKTTGQLSIKKIPCQQKSNQLLQLTPVAQFNYDLIETNNNVNHIDTNSRIRSNYGFPFLGFAMPPPILAFQLQEFGPSYPHGGPKYNWLCVAVCVGWCGENMACLNSCMLNCIVN